MFNNIFPSKTLTKNKLITVPSVRFPQKLDITWTPTVFGSKPWYWNKNSEDQLLIPCSTPT